MLGVIPLAGGRDPIREVSTRQVWTLDFCNFGGDVGHGYHKHVALGETSGSAGPACGSAESAQKTQRKQNSRRASWRKDTHCHGRCSLIYMYTIHIVLGDAHCLVWVGSDGCLVWPAKQHAYGIRWDQARRSVQKINRVCGPKHSCFRRSARVGKTRLILRIHTS